MNDFFSDHLRKFFITVGKRQRTCQNPVAKIFEPDFLIIRFHGILRIKLVGRHERLESESCFSQPFIQSVDELRSVSSEDFLIVIAVFDHPFHVLVLFFKPLELWLDFVFQKQL